MHNFLRSIEKLNQAQNSEQLFDAFFDTLKTVSNPEKVVVYDISHTKAPNYTINRIFNKKGSSLSRLKETSIPKDFEHIVASVSKEGFVAIENSFYIFIPKVKTAIEIVVEISHNYKPTRAVFNKVQTLSSMFKKHYILYKNNEAISKNIDEVLATQSLTEQVLDEVDIKKSFKTIYDSMLKHSEISYITVVNYRDRKPTIYFISENRMRESVEDEILATIEKEYLSLQKKKISKFEKVTLYSKNNFLTNVPTNINKSFLVDIDTKLKGMITLFFKTEKSLFSAHSNIDNYINLMKSSLARFNTYQSIRNNYLKTIKALAIAVDAKDSYTHTHSENVMKYSEMIARTMELSDNEVDTIRNGALLHDIGKIGTPGYILNKPEALSKDEYEHVMRQHVVIGANIIKEVPFLEEISLLVFHHHERYDGTGYPSGLKGKKIPLGARIIAVADVFDALTTDRPYRKAMSIDQALEIIKEHSGTYFDPAIVAILEKFIIGSTASIANA